MFLDVGMTLRLQKARNEQDQFVNNKEGRKGEDVLLVDQHIRGGEVAEEEGEVEGGKKDGSISQEHDDSMGQTVGGHSLSIYQVRQSVLTPLGGHLLEEGGQVITLLTLGTLLGVFLVWVREKRCLLRPFSQPTTQRGPQQRREILAGLPSVPLFSALLLGRPRPPCLGGLTSLRLPSLRSPVVRLDGWSSQGLVHTLSNLLFHHRARTSVGGSGGGNDLLTERDARSG